MTSAKRNHPSPAREQQLRSQNSCYLIQCLGQHCDCSSLGNRCRRGFFSLWIQAIYGLHFAEKYQLPALVDFSQPLSLYANESLDQADNFWDYYYQQTDIQGTALLNEEIESYPLRIWSRTHFRTYATIVQNLRYQPWVKQYLHSLEQKILGQKVLGMHIRLTDHPVEVEPVGLKPYHLFIDKHQNRYDKFYIATDDQNIIEQLVDQWGHQRILYQQATRAQDQQAIHTDFRWSDRKQLGLEALADCYMLSKCSHSLLVHSNLSYAALLLNPELSYTLLETAHCRKQRWRTGLVYWLDRWGIRKM